MAQKTVVCACKKMVRFVTRHCPSKGGKLNLAGERQGVVVRHGPHRLTVWFCINKMITSLPSRFVQLPGITSKLKTLSVKVLVRWLAVSRVLVQEPVTDIIGDVATLLRCYRNKH